MTNKELFIQANGFNPNDPILNNWNEKRRNLDISQELRIKLSKGLYEYNKAENGLS